MNIIKDNKVFYITILCIFITLITLSLIVRNSFKGTLDFSEANNIVNKFQFEYGTAAGDYYNNYDDINFDVLKEDAELIIKVTLTNNREVLKDCILTKVGVSNVIKGKELINDFKEVYVYEPVSFHYPSKTVSTIGGYNLMKYDKEYILLLKRLKLPDKYNASEKQKLSFMLLNPEFSKFNMENENNGLYKVARESDFNNGEITFNNIEEYDQIFLDDKKLNDFINLKSKVVNECK